MGKQQNRPPRKNGAQREEWQKKEEAKRRQAREATLSSRSDIRAEMQAPRSDQRGTAPGALGAVKMQSEEARLQMCPECGYSGGRHARICSRAQR